MARRDRRKPSRVGGAILIVGLVWLISIIIWLAGQVRRWTPIGQVTVWSLVVLGIAAGAAWVSGGLW